MSATLEQDPDHLPCSGCGELLDVTAFEPLETAICPGCKTETTVKKSFGDFTLKSRFAVGGMSVVYIAEDTILNREVAIKVLNEEFSVDEARVAAFENEARLTAAVNHPNVIDVYTVGRAYGRFYLVMELLDGVSFERIMNTRGALPEEEVLDIALQVAAGLQAAQQSGMIHRDVKPGNILIDKSGHTKLLDFGLALITHAGSAQAKEIWATPFYVPPEVLERGIEDFRSDIYAFGATLYHALAGRPPFETTSTSNKILRDAKQTIPRLTKVADWISPATGEAIDRMMTFKPENRWASYPDLIEALEHARRNIGKKITSPVHSTSRRQRRPQRSRTLLIAGSATILILGTVLAIWRPWHKPKIPLSENTGKVPPPPAMESWEPSVGGEDQTIRITKAWEAARTLVAQRKFSESESRFVTLSGNETLPDTTRAWATLEAAVSALLDSRGNDARKHAVNLVPFLKDIEDGNEVKETLKHFSEVLQHPRPPTPEQFPRDLDNILNRMGSLALSLKLWEQGQWKDAAARISAIQSLPPDENFEWFKSYQNLIKLYLEDAETYSELAEFNPPNTPEEATRQIQELHKALEQLKMKGRIRYNMRSRQAYLVRIKKGLEIRPEERPVLSWTDSVAKASEKIAQHNYAEAGAILDDGSEKAPPEGLWAWQFLIKQSALFLNDFEAMTNWEAQTREGRDVRPLGASAEGVALSDGRTMAYAMLDPFSLVTAHTKAREKLAPAENRERLIHAIAFAWLCGMNEVAESQAEELAETDEEFRANWKRVIVGLSEK